MSTIVFIPGMWHNAACFDQTIKQLKERGYNAVALTCKGNEPESDNRTVTFDEMIDSVVEFCKKINDRLIIACHSSGGTITLNAAPKFSDKIDKIIFNNAFVLPHGECQFDYIPDDIENRMTKSAKSTHDDAIPVDEENVREKLMTYAKEEDIVRLLKILVPQPLVLMNTPSNSNDFFTLKSIPKRLVHCTKDKTFPPYGYAQMFKNIPGVSDNDIIHIDADHQAFFSNPDLFIDAFVKCLEI